MPEPELHGLLTQLHARFANSETSPEQDALMQQLQSQLSDWNGPGTADGSVVTTVEMLLEELQEKHPQLSQVLREIVDTMGKIGI